ncbi:MAG: hypothetical protein M3R17_20425 [Bacteroidota bacterium]|nr:hypothetical protein [Bacteroidota bacterium]
MLFAGIPILILVLSVKVLKGKPVIKLNNYSIWWKAEITDDLFFIPWSEILRFESGGRFFLNKSILVFVERPERFVQGNWKAVEKQRKRIKETGTHLAIPINFIEQTQEEMLVILNNYLDTVKGKRGAMVMPQL